MTTPWQTDDALDKCLNAYADQMLDCEESDPVLVDLAQDLEFQEKVNT